KVMLLLVRAAEGAEKGEEDRAEHIERRQPRGDQAHGPENPLAVGGGGVEDLVLAEEARERRDSRDGQGTDYVRPEGRRHVLSQAAHLRHVLLAAHGMDHRARAEEE